MDENLESNEVVQIRMNEVRVGQKSSATLIPKRELSSFTPEEIKQSLH